MNFMEFQDLFGFPIRITQKDFKLKILSVIEKREFKFKRSVEKV